MWIILLNVLSPSSGHFFFPLSLRDSVFCLIRHSPLLIRWKMITPERSHWLNGHKLETLVQHCFPSTSESLNSGQLMWAWRTGEPPDLLRCEENETLQNTRSVFTLAIKLTISGARIFHSFPPASSDGGDFRWKIREINVNRLWIRRTVTRSRKQQAELNEPLTVG